MRVLHLISSGGMYGAEAVILNVSRAMEDAGHHSMLAVFHNFAKPNLQVHQAALAAGIESHLLDCSGQVDRRVVPRLRELVRHTQADLLHAHGYKSDIYAYFALRGRGLPLISTCHTWLNNDIFENIYGKADRFVLRSFDGVIAVSSEVREQLTLSGTQAAKVRVVLNGIDLNRFAEAASRPRSTGGRAGYTIGVIARLSPEKGHTFFLEAAVRVLVEFPDCRFALFGDGPERPALEALAGRLGIQSSVTFAGRRSDMPAVYASLDMQVFSSLQEGLPVALLEGMASRLPIVATAVGEIPAVLRNGEAGRIVSPGDVKALAEAMLQLLRHPAEWEALADAGYEQVKTNFSASRTAEEYLDVYRGVLQGRKNREAAW